MAILSLTESNFKEEVLESGLPVLVDFWAPWCGPCRLIAPLLEELAQEYAKIIKFAKINIDEYPRIASHYGIMSIPTLIFFLNGKIAEQVAGALTKAELKKKLQQYSR